MLNIPTLKFDKSTKYLHDQLKIQNNNKQLILDIISNIGVINNSSEDESKNEDLLNKANDLHQKISDNITTIEKLDIEIKNITKDLSLIVSEQNKKNKTKEFFIASIKNIQQNILTTTKNIQDAEKKIEEVNTDFNNFINENNFQYNFTNDNTDEYELTSFSVNGQEVSLTEEPTFTNHEEDECAQDEVQLTENRFLKNAEKINKITDEFKELLTDLSFSDSIDTNDKIKDFIESKLSIDLFENEYNTSQYSNNDDVTISENDLIDAIAEDFIDDNHIPEPVLEPKNEDTDPSLKYVKIEQDIINYIKDNISIIIYNRFDKNPERKISTENPFAEEDSILKINEIAKKAYYQDDYDEGFSNLYDSQNQSSYTGYNGSSYEFSSPDSYGLDIEPEEDVPTAFDSMQFINDILIDIQNKEQVETIQEELSKISNEQEAANENLENHLNKYEKIRKHIVEATGNNNYLLISEKMKQIFLPYKISELEEYMKAYPDAYPNIKDVVRQEFTFSYDYFNKHIIQSRAKELFLLMKDREEKPIKEVMKYIVKMINRSDLNPAVIAACKTRHELESYLYYLDENNLQGFKFFDIIYEVDDSDQDEKSI